MDLFDEFLKYCDGAKYPGGQVEFDRKFRSFVTNFPFKLQVNETLSQVFQLDKDMMLIVQGGWEVPWQ